MHLLKLIFKFTGGINHKKPEFLKLNDIAGRLLLMSMFLLFYSVLIYRSFTYESYLLKIKRRNECRLQEEIGRNINAVQKEILHFNA